MQTLTAKLDAAYRNIDAAVQRIEKVAEMMERQARTLYDRTIYNHLLALEVSKQESATLPCNTLPVAENRRFYGRQDILKELDRYLQPADTTTPLSSLALYGLSGIGKTQTALAYAYQKLDDLDAVFWIPAENEYSIQQGFSKVTVDALQLEKARPRAHQKNMILLLIFDNVDQHDVLDNCWPASQHGAVLVTTRDVLVATLPIDTGRERRARADGELEAAQGVTKQLGGLLLALNQMAALINARNYYIKDFGALYSKNEQRLHKQRKNGWKYIGYQHGLDTMQEIPFSNLRDGARAYLGVLSFFSPGSVLSEIFTAKEVGALPPLLSFYEDEFRWVTNFYRGNGMLADKIKP
ncbi:hypothetical protein LCI18_013417 [Fusarium solani-melongenae]|uniref:Uncharacterized protein n=1 Tax=Fusarium solani subsp. cucurbitae TaxID=2747967 RepID=A0ACD3ZMQ7_FUSSC|nr:hypothetical protein LCI18_013417 [Fusarium solani-melongenae]